MIFESIFKRSSVVSPTHPRDPVLAEIWGNASNTAAGVRVTADTALQIIAVYAAVRVIAEAIASLPLRLYRRRRDDTRELARNHGLDRVLHMQPNEWQTSFEWREMTMGHVLLRGNAYSEVIYNNSGSVAQLIPLRPDRVTPFRAPDGQIAYEHYPDNGERRILLFNEVHHIRGLSTDGLMGLDPIALARQSLGMTAAAEEFGARFFGNGTVVGGYLRHPNQLSEEAQHRLVKAWEDRHQGVTRSHRPAVLEEGMEWQSLGIEPEKAQFLETRKFQVNEIARMFRVPPHMLGDLERATFSNIEHQSTEFVRDTLRPWLVRHEQAIWRDLLSTEGQRTYYAEYNAEGLLRGDLQSRAQFYKDMWNISVFSANDIRRKENMDPYEGGDAHYVQVNMQPANGIRDLYPLYRQAYAKIITAQVRQLRRELERAENADDFRVRAAEFLANDHRQFIEKNLGPVYEATHRDTLEEDVRNFLIQTGDALEAAEDVSALLDEWDINRAKEIALIETENLKRENE